MTVGWDLNLASPFIFHINSRASYDSTNPVAFQEAQLDR